MAQQLWDAETAAPWQESLQAVDSIWQQHASDKLQDLNRWYEAELPEAISSRQPQQHITQAELVQLVDWKLTRGKWRPRLLDFAKAAKEQDVVDASKKAFSILLQQQQQQQAQQQQQQQQAPSPEAVSAALSALTVLKGVGPATASALLAAADSSGSTPFMSDEALEAAVGSRSYTAQEYLQLVEALRDKAAWLQQQDPGSDWTAVKVERCLYAAALAAKPAKQPAKKPAAGSKKRSSSATGAAAAGKQGRKLSKQDKKGAKEGSGGGLKDEQAKPAKRKAAAALGGVQEVARKPRTGKTYA